MSDEKPDLPSPALPPEALRALAELDRHLHELADAAIAAYREALQRDPKHAKAWHNLIFLQLEGVNYSVAEMYKHIDTQDPQIAPIVQKAEAVMDLFDVPQQP